MREKWLCLFRYDEHHVNDPIYVFPSQILFFLQYGDNHNSNWKTVPEAVSNEDNPWVRGISLESTAAFCRCWNWKCVKLKCPEIKTVAWAVINWKLKSLARSGSPSNQDRLIEVRLGTFWGRIELIIVIFALGQGPLLSFLSDLRGHFSRLGNGPETG